MTVPVVGIDGTQKGTISLPASIFSVTASEQLIAQSVRVYQANQRQGGAKVKTRGDVAGSRRKIWRQKGTGRARHGDRYAPIFVGGGIAHGPVPRDFSLSMSKKMRRKALSAVLTKLYNQGNIVVVDGLEKLTGKTADTVTMLKALSCDMKRSALTRRVCIATPAKVDVVYRSGRNVSNLTVREAQRLTTYELLLQSKLVLAKDAIAVLEALLTS
ncbi:50S ribosomal protein L4 [Candidatus Roizmanbacteria bacterium RIFCSPLOWO2_01_FULL_45_11]|uniref:Large ribosomal subunit protein uL4 n=1 Tax=Candidatus Roizmanbacteria bacterium RIFCSPLOWO2_01_FULL_45_11 TaxID=1802070 RepID=A0A1F7JDC0_9BACT|nr:MAG: 50S ribosomal protein L4 [Candidatus Roizmanbacteria bacterium RIFCSPLOWO2_01_FULL_45_11]